MKMQGTNTIRRLISILLMAMFNLGITGAVMAAEDIDAGGADQPGIAWDALSPAQQKVLARQKDQWGGYAGARQQRLARGAQRWLDMDDTQRTAAATRFEKWNSLPVETRRDIRRRYAEFMLLPENERAKMRHNFARFKDLDDRQRQALKRKWQGMSPEERAKRLHEWRQRRMNR